MKIFLAGAAGVIGRRLVPLLIDAGHSVVGTTRSIGKAEALKAAGVEPVVVDVFDAAALARAVAGARAEIVIHQLTDLPPGLDPSLMGDAMLRNARIRDEGTRNLVSAMQAAGVGRLIAQSIAWMYAEGPLPHKENDPLDHGAQGPRAVTVAGVAALERLTTSSPPIEGIVLRYGRFYGPETRSEAAREAPVVHIDAAAHAALLAVERGRARNLQHRRAERLSLARQGYIGARLRSELPDAAQHFADVRRMTCCGRRVRPFSRPPAPLRSAPPPAPSGSRPRSSPASLSAHSRPPGSGCAIASRLGGRRAFSSGVAAKVARRSLMTRQDGSWSESPVSAATSRQIVAASSSRGASMKRLASLTVTESRSWKANSHCVVALTTPRIGGVPAGGATLKCALRMALKVCGAKRPGTSVVAICAGVAKTTMSCAESAIESCSNSSEESAILGEGEAAQAPLEAHLRAAAAQQLQRGIDEGARQTVPRRRADGRRARRAPRSRAWCGRRARPSR